MAERSKALGTNRMDVGSNLADIYFCLPRSGFKTSTFGDIYCGKNLDKYLENCLNILWLKNIDNFLQIEVCPNFMP